MSDVADSKYHFSYQEVKPPAELSHLAFCFFEFAIECTAAKLGSYEVVPDGFAGILFKRDLSAADADLLLVRALSVESFSAPVSPGDVHWGIRMSPAANRLIFRKDPRTIPTMPITRQGILPHVSELLYDKINGLSTFEEAAQVFTSFLRSLAIEPCEIDNSVQQAVEMIMESRGTIKIGEISEKLDIGKRQLERRFRKEVGLTLKQYARVFRIRSTAVSLIEEDNLNWANRAAEMGFADQSHLIKEFIALTGRRPKGFMTDIEKMKYGKFIR